MKVSYIWNSYRKSYCNRKHSIKQERSELYSYSSSECSSQGQVLHSKRTNLGYSSAEDRSSTAHSGTKTAFLLKGRSSTINSLTRDGYVLSAHPTLFLASEQALKDLKRSQGHQRGGTDSEFG